MNKTISVPLWFSIFLAFLFACSSQDSHTSVSSSNTPLGSVAFVPTQTKPNPIQISTETLAPTSTPYPTKEVVLGYNFRAIPLPFDDILGDAYSILVLYSDGQMLTTGESFQQKVLTKEEMHLFLSQLESMELYTLETNQKHDPTDRLYDFGNQYEIDEMGFWHCVTTKERVTELCAYDPYKEFLVPKMKIVLQFLDEYKPEGMSPYNPDRILLRVRLGRNPNLQDLSEKALPWSEHFPSLETTDQKTMFVEGKTASEIFSFLNGELYSKIVIENGIEYTIEYLRPVLPHEVMSYP